MLTTTILSVLPVTSRKYCQTPQNHRIDITTSLGNVQKWPQQLVRDSSSHTTVRMAPVILFVVAVGALAQYGLSDPLAIHGNYIGVFAGYNLKQRFSHQTGGVSENTTQ